MPESSQIMKCFVMHGIGRVGVMDKLIPRPGPNDAIIRTTAALICTSDTHTVAGVLGAEVWPTFTEPNQPPPVGVDPMRFVALATTAPYQITFTAADAGMTAHDALPWLSTTDERGPWREVCATTIPA